MSSETPTTPPKTRRSTRLSTATPKIEKEVKKEEKKPSTPVKKTPAKNAPKRTANTDVQHRPAKRRNVRKSDPGESTSDPFSFDDKEDEHPELFKKVKVERQSFGSMKFFSNGNGDESKFANMEKNISERRSLVPELLNKTDLSVPSAKTTPKARRSSSSSTPKSSKARASRKSESETKVKLNLAEESDESEVEKEVKTPKATPKQVKKRTQQSEAVPKTPKIEEKAPVLTAEEQIKADDENHANYPPGARVFAIWGKEYYSAVVADRDGLGRYKVFYTEDQSVRVIPSTGIVPLYLIKKDIELSVVGEKDEDGERIIYNGKVLDIPDMQNPEEWIKGKYSIEVSNEEQPDPENREINWFDIYLTEKQYKQVMKTKKNPTELARENIIEGEEGGRTRRSRRSNATTPVVATPSSTRTKATPRKKTPKVTKIVEEEEKNKDEQKLEEDVEMDDESKKQLDKEPDNEEKEDEEKEQEEEKDEKQSEVKEKTKEEKDELQSEGEDKHKEKEKQEEEGGYKDEDEEMEVDSDLNKDDKKEQENGVELENNHSSNGHDANGKEESIEKSEIDEQRVNQTQQIFEGLYFILTSANRSTGPPPFTKKDVKKSIENRGGLVIENFDRIKEDDKVYLIADTYYRTHKYLTALSLSIPTVSYKWIEDSVSKNELSDYEKYMLDAGESLVDQKKYPWKDVKGNVFTDKRIAIFSQRNVNDSRVVNFREIWAPLVKNIGGVVVNDIPVDFEEFKEWFSNNEAIEYFITDEGTSKSIIDYLKESGCEPVNSEWLIECIITGDANTPILERHRPKAS